MDNYKKQIRTLRNELHNNKKELKAITKTNQKYKKLMNISVCTMICCALIMIPLIIFQNLTLFTPLIISEMIIGIIYSLLEYYPNKKDEEKNAIFNSNTKIKEEIKNIHYFYLEKQRNLVLNECNEDSLESIETQKELLLEYKSKIKGIYDNNIPKEIDKEIEYLNKKVKTLKLDK